MDDFLTPFIAGVIITIAVIFFGAKIVNVVEERDSLRKTLNETIQQCERGKQ